MARLIRTLAIAAVITAATASAGAQPPPGGGPGGRVGGGARGPITLTGDIETIRHATLDFIGGEIPLGPIVRGAPFSGEGVTTSSQTLGDGTKITLTVSAKVSRDGEGRLRREQTILGLGALATSGDAPTIVTIVDPVAGVQYVLDTARKEARKSQMPAMGRGARGRSNEGGADIGGVPPPPPPPPPPPDGVRERLDAAQGALRRGGPGRLPNAPEPLGTKLIEGVNANGVRRTETIPAGTIGNDRPITITDERWESPELRVLVQSEHHDPRTGDVKYRLTNINRSEPDGILFTVPSDYTVRDAPPLPPPAPGARGRGRGDVE